MCTNIISIFKFVKILNHFQVQVLLIKKIRSFLRLLWAEIFLRQFSKFWHTWAIFCVPTVNMWHFVSTYKDQIKYPKSFWAQYQFVTSKRRIPSVFFLKFIFSKLFIVIFTLKMYSFFTCQFKWSSN